MSSSFCLLPMASFKRNVLKSCRKLWKVWRATLLVTVILVVGLSSLRRPTCPSFLGTTEPQLHGLCRQLFSGDDVTVALANQYEWCDRSDDVITETDYVIETKNCSSFAANRGYLSHHVTIDELEFPVAFSILMYENVEQVERLLRLIYRPQNVYCIHVDAKSPVMTHLAARAIAGCFDNVFVADESVSVVWGMYSVLDADLKCMRRLIRRDVITWKYFVNLVGRDFPLLSNRQLVRVLRAYNGSNDIEGTFNR